MELLAYILIMLAMGAIGWICYTFDSFGETPIGFVGAIASGIFALMFLGIVAAGICVILGVEVSA